jgi:hypothetical protein
MQSQEKFLSTPGIIKYPVFLTTGYITKRGMQLAVI